MADSEVPGECSCLQEHRRDWLFPFLEEMRIQALDFSRHEVRYFCSDIRQQLLVPRVVLICEHERQVFFEPTPLPSKS